MSSLFAQGNRSLNQQSNQVFFADSDANLSNVVLRINGSDNWSPSSNYSVYNVLYVPQVPLPD